MMLTADTNYKIQEISPNEFIVDGIICLHVPIFEYLTRSHKVV